MRDFEWEFAFFAGGVNDVTFFQGCEIDHIAFLKSPIQCAHVDGDELRPSGGHPCDRQVAL